MTELMERSVVMKAQREISNLKQITNLFMKI